MIELNKIYNEDCRVTMAKMPDNYVDLILTSPPYNFDAGSGMGNKYKKKFNDKLTQSEYYDFSVEVIAEAMRVSKLVLWNIQFLAGNKIALLKYLGHFSEQIREIIIWNKTNPQFTFNPNMLNSSFEFILILDKNKGGRKIEYSQFKQGTQNNVISLPANHNMPDALHTAKMPTRLATKLIKMYSKENDVVYDPFLGSGTTAVVSKMLNRNFIGSEIVDEYFDLSVNNLEKADHLFMEVV
jgi:site-specific DNA-methyltransferase (adenine-specific)